MNNILKTTKTGRYVNVACKENYTNANWIPLASVIGLAVIDAVRAFKHCHGPGCRIIELFPAVMAKRAAGKNA